MCWVRPFALLTITGLLLAAMDRIVQNTHDD